MPEADRGKIPGTDEASAEQNAELDYQPETDDTPAAEEEQSQEPIPDEILNTTRADMVGFVETRPDAYVTRLEVSATEWMAITDDSLANELERELLTSVAAMCLWQE